MPYGRKEELPGPVREHLPAHAQEVYRKAFNSAWDQYADESARRTEESREEVAHKVAWSAVRHAGYEKGDDGDWHRRG